MQKYKAVIFDFGGVFTSSPVEEFAVFEREHGLPEKFIGGVIKKDHHTNAWAKFERSEMTRAEFNTAFAKESKQAGFEIAGDTLLSLLKLKLKPDMAAALQEIKDAGFLTGCITNNLPSVGSGDMVEDEDERKQVEAIMLAFDHAIESSKAGVRKPEPVIYTMMSDALGVQPDECIFLDDLGINLKPAKALGMTTIKVPFGDVTPAIEALMQYLRLR